MRKEQYEQLCGVREHFRNAVESIGHRVPELLDLQEQLRIERGYTDYRVETPVVYNGSLDSLREEDEPVFIIVGDNPGKKEQLAANRRYLVGQSGKLAARWFERELRLDFRRSTIILNKTPIHTPKTSELRHLIRIARNRGIALEETIRESQRMMADIAFRCHRILGGVLWISGYGELGPRGIFHTYAETIGTLYRDFPGPMGDPVWVLSHFSMNRFAIEYRSEALRTAGQHTEMAGEDGGNKARALLHGLGTRNRNRLLGF